MIVRVKAEIKRKLGECHKTKQPCYSKNSSPFLPTAISFSLIYIHTDAFRQCQI